MGVIYLFDNKKMKSYRTQKHITQKKLGSICSPQISESTIRKYELGLLNPKFETACRIADALDVPICELWPSISLDYSSLKKANEQNENITHFDKYVDSNGKEVYFPKQSFYIKSMKGDSINTYNINSEFLAKHKNLDELLINITKDYVKNISDIDIDFRAEIYNTLYSYAFYDENTNTMNIYPYVPIELLEPYNKLNSKGKEKAIEQVEMLTKIDEYTKNDENT